MSTILATTATRTVLAAVILPVFLGMGAVGCGKEAATPAAPPAAAERAPSKAKKEPPANSAERLPVAPEYAYRAEGRRDPFESLVKGAEVKPVVKKPGGGFVAVVEGGQYSPLQRYDLEELRLVGIVKVEGGYRALVEVADGKSYFLSNGTRVGRNGGVVSRVLEDRVVITETYRNPLGETRTKDVYLTFAKKGGE